MGSCRVKCLSWDALCPPKSGLMNKHIVKHIVLCEMLRKMYTGKQTSDRLRVEPDRQPVCCY
jgi:hypothetical protein